jgi:hypothetical protein
MEWIDLVAICLHDEIFILIEPTGLFPLILHAGNRQVEELWRSFLSTTNQLVGIIIL